jgi:hypothetical protein
VLATADLVVLALRVLPEEIRESLNAERNLPGKRKEGVGTSDSAREDLGSGQARWPAGNACSFATCGKSEDGEILERR